MPMPSSMVGLLTDRTDPANGSPDACLVQHARHCSPLLPASNPKDPNRGEPVATLTFRKRRVGA